MGNPKATVPGVIGSVVGLAGPVTETWVIQRLPCQAL